MSLICFCKQASVSQPEFTCFNNNVLDLELFLLLTLFVGVSVLPYDTKECKRTNFILMCKRAKFSYV